MPYRRRHRSHKGRSVYSRAKSFFRSKGGKSEGIMPVLVTGALYGASRDTIANMATPITNMLPFGQYNDEVTFGIIGWYLAKHTGGYKKALGRTA